MVDAQLIDAIPKFSLAYIDILHNSVETIETCEIIGGFVNDYTNISCISDYGSQAEDDIIKINPKKKYGIIEWSTTLKSSETIIGEITEGSGISLQFIDDYDFITKIIFGLLQYRQNLTKKKIQEENMLQIFILYHKKNKEHQLPLAYLKKDNKVLQQ